MFAENRKISLRQLQILLLLDSFGTAVLFLPAELAQLSGKGCWVAALIGGGLFALLSFLIAYMGQRMPEGTVVHWCRRCFGYRIGTAVIWGLGGKLLFDGVLELRLFSEILCRFMLPHTPIWVISLVVLLVASLLAAQGVEGRGRTAEILFFLVVIPLLLVLLSVAVSAEYGRLRPMELPQLREMGESLLAMSLVFQGLPFLYFVFPYLRKREAVPRAAGISSLLTGGIVTVIVLLCLAVYGDGTLARKLLPTLQMMERISFTGVFLTRQDVLLLWFWMASVCIFLSGVLFYGALCGHALFRKSTVQEKNWRWGIFVLLFALSFLPEELSMAYRLRLAVAPWLNLIYLVLLPIALLLCERGGKMDV